ncbi:MAG: hypothetical protein OXJ52_02590 [Oligoflexia bacterium]|nr:hypothetical protein [Oligoflexia bacterium]
MKQLKILFFIFCVCSCDKAFITAESLIKDKSLTDHLTHYYIYPELLPGLFSTEYYKIKAYLNHEDSRLILFSHFNGFEIEDGVKIKFERKQADLIITASVQNSDWKTLLQTKNYFLNSSEIDFTVRVKNGARKGADVSIWENFIIKNKVIKLNRRAVTKETLLTGTEDIIFYEKGEGLKWGLKLFRSRFITGARVSPPLL